MAMLLSKLGTCKQSIIVIGVSVVGTDCSNLSMYSISLHAYAPALWVVTCRDKGLRDIHRMPIA